MSTEYRHWLIPDDAALRPPGRALVALVEALVGEGWALPVQATVRRSLGRGTPIVVPIARDLFRDDDALDLRVTLSMPENTVRDPFVRTPVAFGGLVYGMSIDRAGRDLGYVHRSFEKLADFDDDDRCCPCGADLAFELDPKLPSPLDEERRIHTTCPACRRPFDVRSLLVTAHDLWDDPRRAGLTRELPGGATSCFAISIYTGEEYPFDEAHPVPTLVPALRRLCERATGCAFSEVGERNC